jgi:N-acetylmuramoyl-L-alanine amidase
MKMRIILSSGHGKYVRGAEGYLDEVDEARRVVERVAEILDNDLADVTYFHDDVSKNQSDNLDTIVAFHNNRVRDLDVSVHFNAYETTNSPMGTECLYVTQAALAQKVATAIAGAGGFKNRGPKKRTDLAFLNNTTAPAILIEVCFVDSLADERAYQENFAQVCLAIAETISGVEQPPIEAVEPPPVSAGFSVTGRASTFGGPTDEGVSPNEGLAFIYRIEDAPQLFLPIQPTGTTGLARRLNPYVHYVACRWDYSVTPKPMLLEHMALVRAPGTGIEMQAFPADWGPHIQTGRVADLSPSLMADLGITTDEEVEVIFPI